MTEEIRQGFEAGLWLRQRGVRSGRQVPDLINREVFFGIWEQGSLERLVPLAEDAPYVQAEQFRLDPTGSAVEASGRVVITATSSDGAMVTIRADQVTIE